MDGAQWPVIRQSAAMEQFLIPHSPVVVAYARVTGGYAKSMISTDSEIEDYLTFLRGKLKAAIAAGQRIAFN